LSIILAFVLSAVHAGAQQFPLPPTYDAILKSPINSYITISYKKPNVKACATAFDTQKQYSGYVNLLPFSLAPYQQNYTIQNISKMLLLRALPNSCIILGKTSLPEPVLYGTQNHTQSYQSISHTQVPAASFKCFPVLVPIERSVSPEEAIPL
jgi:hypothetical protein